LLTSKDNERLVRIGPGTPAGELLRRYWQPAALSSELLRADGPPIRIRMLGEDLLGFRDTDGKVAVVDAFCPHRRAPLFFGRNEQCGIRCAYHGWKFDRQGNCVDMPSEPAGTSLQAKVRLKTYPTVEAGGVIWAYMGPPGTMPAPPNFEWLRVPASHRHVSKTLEHCNYLQAMEGGFDTAHSSFVHNNRLSDNTQVRNRDRSPRIEVSPTNYGYWYSSTRTVSPNTNYVRVYHYVMPNQQMRGAVTSPDGRRADVPKLDGHLWVPIDDEHTYVYNWFYGYDETAAITPEYANEFETFAGRGPDDLIAGTFRLKRNLGNDYLIDRELQKSVTYTGITGLNTQDFALQEGMGPIVDRSKEFLGTSDKAVVALRRLLLEAIEVVERGATPRGADPTASSDLRAYDGLVSATADWRECFAQELKSKW
jgi:phthalate 4,5-dioxygenase